MQEFIEVIQFPVRGSPELASDRFGVIGPVGRLEAFEHRLPRFAEVVGTGVAQEGPAPGLMVRFQGILVLPLIGVDVPMGEGRARRRRSRAAAAGRPRHPRPR